MTEPIKTQNGHMYHGSPQDEIIARLRKELKEMQQERDMEKRLRLQYEESHNHKLVRDVAGDIEDLSSLATQGWPKDDLGQSGNHRGRQGDGEAASKLMDVESSLYGLHRSVVQFLRKKEAQAKGILEDSGTKKEEFVS